MPLERVANPAARAAERVRGGIDAWQGRKIDAHGAVVLTQDSSLDGIPLAGELPPGKHKLVVAWIEIHREDLLADWNLAVNGKTPFPIKGLDQ